MMRAVAAVMLMAIAVPATAQHAAHDAAGPPPSPPAQAKKCAPEHAAMGHCMPARDEPSATPPPPASSGPEHAADAVWGADVMAPVRRAVYAEHGSFQGGKLLIDRIELKAQDGRDGYAWEGEGWYGGDYDRLWIKTQGEGRFGTAPGAAEVQALWSRALDPWFNIQTGIRYDLAPGRDRAHLVLGVQGLAPYWFEIDAAAFLSDRGDLTARIEGEYDQRITNRLIAQPRLELNLSAQDVPSAGVGAGISSIGTGLRLRYEFVPEFAPYIGIEYERAIGRTVGLTQPADNLGVVAGIRAWF